MEDLATQSQVSQCGAKRRNGETCHLSAGYGTEHLGKGKCKFHGGSTPSHVNKWRAEAAKEKLEEAAELYGLPEEVEPAEALLQELHRTAGHVAWLNDEIRTMKDEDELYGPVGGGKDSHPSVHPHVFLRLYQEERKHLAAVAKMCLDAGIAERQVRIAEQQGVIIASMLKALLKELGVTMNVENRTIVRKHLTQAAESQRALDAA